MSKEDRVSVALSSEFGDLNLVGTPEQVERMLRPPPHEYTEAMTVLDAFAIADRVIAEPSPDLRTAFADALLTAWRDGHAEGERDANFSWSNDRF